jgi:hypothetical protein
MITFKSKKNFLYVLFIFVSIISGCSNNNSKICGSKEIENELIKKAVDQKLISSIADTESLFSILSIEEEKDKSDKTSDKGVLCTAKGKLEFNQKIQETFKNIQKLVKQSHPQFVDNFSYGLTETKIIYFRVKKNEINDSITIDGVWNEEEGNPEIDNSTATALHPNVLEIIKNEKLLINDIKTVELILTFKSFILDKKTDIAKSGKQVKEYIVNNKIPLLHCTLSNDDAGNHFDCRIANDRAAMNILVRFENIEEFINENFPGKNIKLNSVVRDVGIESIIDNAEFIQYKNDSFENYKIIHLGKLQIQE